MAIDSSSLVTKEFVTNLLAFHQLICIMYVVIEFTIIVILIATI
jgi:hypothetical protein